MHRQSEKNLLSSNMSSRRPHNMVNFGPLAAKIGLRVWGTPANFNGFRVLAATLLTGSQPNFARCLAVSWAGTLYIHFRGILPPNGILPGAKFTLRSNVAFCYIDSVTARYSTCGRAGVWRVSLINVALCNRGAIIFLCCGLFFFFFFFFLFFPRLISAAADRMSAILPHMVGP